MTRSLLMLPMLSLKLLVAMEPPADLGTLLLSADEVARRAQATSFEIRARADERAAAQAAVDQALAAYLPRLSGAARYTRLSHVQASSLGNIVVAPGTQAGSTPDATRLVATPLQFPTIENQYVVQATLQVGLSDYLLRFPYELAAAEADARASALGEQATTLRVATEARIGYYGWLRARMQVRIAEQAVAQARGHLEDAQHATEAGAVSSADVTRVEAQVAAAELLQARARSMLIICETQLRTLMHDAPGRRYHSVEDLAEPAAAGGIADPTSPELWREAVQRRVELLVLAERATAARRQAKLALVPGLPRLDAVGNATYANPNSRIFPQTESFRGTWDASVQLAWAPSDLPAARAARRMALARAAALDEQRSALGDAIKLEVIQAATALTESRVAIAAAERGQRAAEESYRIRRLLFQNGRATSVELTDAETELTRARMELASAQIDLRVADTRLAHALGRDRD